MNRIKEKSEKINILIAADHVGYKGNLAGVGRYLTYIIPNLDKKRFNIILIILRNDSSLKNRFEGTGIKIVILRRKKYDPYTFIKFINIIKKENVHILHLHQYASSNFGRLAGKMTGIPTILHVHDLSYNYSWIQWIADRLLKKTTNYVFAVSEAVKLSCSRTRAVDLNKIFVIPNAVPAYRFQHLDQEKCQAQRRRWGLNTECHIVGTLTRFHEVKGNEFLLKAARNVLKALPNTYFVLVGDGPLMQKLKENTIELGIQHNVIFTGYQEDVVGLMSIFDVNVIASNTEGCSLSLLEAMVMGKATVATEVGGIREILRQGVTGILIPPQNPQAMAEKIIYLLQNEQEREIIGANAYRESTRYTLDSHIKTLENVYREATDKA